MQAKLHRSFGNRKQFRHFPDRLVEDIMQHYRLAVFGGKLSYRPAHNFGIERLHHLFGSAGRTGWDRLIHGDFRNHSVLRGLCALRGTDIVHQNRLHPLVERAFTLEGIDFAQNLVERAEREIFGFCGISAQSKRIAAQTVAIFRNQLRSAFFKVVVYVLDYAHCPIII